MYIRLSTTPGGNTVTVKIPRCGCLTYNPKVGGICNKCKGAILTFDEATAE